MKLNTLILMTGFLMGCARHPESDRILYSPRPVVELSTIAAENRVAAVYVRHSRCNVLLQLIPMDTNDGIREEDHKLVIRLTSPQHRKFTSVRYENFEESVDVFQDGRIILVPLPESDGKVVGVFVNLLSRKRYFFVPSVESNESLAKVRWVRKTRPHIKVVGPEDTRSVELLARFPEFQQ